MSSFVQKIREKRCLFQRFVTSIVAKHGPSEQLNLTNLTLKVTTLMALLSGQRRQTLHILSIDCMQISFDKCVLFH